MRFKKRHSPTTPEEPTSTAGTASPDAKEAFYAQYQQRADDRDKQAAMEAAQQSDYQKSLTAMAREKAANGYAPHPAAFSYANRRSYNQASWWESPLAKPVGGIVLAAVLYGGSAAITDGNYGVSRAEHYLEQAGYTNVTPTDTDYMFIQLQGCDASDSVLYEFQVTAPNGEVTEMDVCKGLFKSATLRQP